MTSYSDIGSHVISMIRHIEVSTRAAIAFAASCDCHVGSVLAQSTDKVCNLELWLPRRTCVLALPAGAFDKKLGKRLSLHTPLGVCSLSGQFCRSVLGRGVNCVEPAC